MLLNGLREKTRPNSRAGRPEVALCRMRAEASPVTGCGTGQGIFAGGL